MPMVVELGIALDVLIGVLILGVFMFQIREQFDSLDIRHLEKLKAEDVTRWPFVLGIPPRPAGWCSVGRPPRQRARRQRGVQPGHLPGGLRADGEVISTARCWRGHEFFIDALNVFLVALTAFVGLTTAIFSRPYMRVERDHGKMTPPRLRLYHSMYQLFSFHDAAGADDQQHRHPVGGDGGGTLTTVLLVSVYCTAASLEAA